MPDNREPKVHVPPTLLERVTKLYELFDETLEHATDIVEPSAIPGEPGTVMGKRISGGYWPFLRASLINLRADLLRLSGPVAPVLRRKDCDYCNGAGRVGRHVLDDGEPCPKCSTPAAPVEGRAAEEPRAWQWFLKRAEDAESALSSARAEIERLETRATDLEGMYNEQIRLKMFQREMREKAEADAERMAALLRGATDALRDVFALMDENELVRNTAFDADPKWMIKAANFVIRLKKAQDALTASDAALSPASTETQCFVCGKTFMHDEPRYAVMNDGKLVGVRHGDMTGTDCKRATETQEGKA
jgi:hypothetical protein